MGKYMKKSKINNDTVSTEPTSFGVRTRAAKILALKRLNSSASSDSSCYLQLRSRRLEKPPSLSEPKQPPKQLKPGLKDSVSKVDSVNSVSVAQDCNGDECSCGENSIEFETRHQSTREITPCNFVEDLEIIVTPGSSMVPTSIELEEFFAYAEQQQQRLFKEKYNFDIVNDVPLTGRYEWVQVSP
ncbi:unnamed protein product [Eruca vesicaria subsp. sativa]|uniref:Cyclin-dependent kinase inhibitor domain-containing protein n=1 Tax=Eruca vesicaria subsp. sativa TaxID=29727 RepID=A0ABC8LW01_ERUVS|nr:unnamed protein product [Eruca vesicaria subsp. sativa]